ncbi:MAG: Tim44 domain-containing protein [Desulfobacteraceae bacterium]|nr:Tim44 domain-containing protein [Desulfobacteraceae bacterium]
MLFGGFGHASSSGGGFGGSGISLFEIIVIGALIYFGMKWFRRRRAEQQASYYEDTSAGQQQQYFGQPAYAPPEPDELERGLDEIRRYDASFNVETFKETVEDMFFRIQAAWMNRNLSGAEQLLSPEMTAYFLSEFSKMKQQGQTNRLENIAVRKVEPSEAWQESGQDYITVLFTANLLDYTVNDQTGEVVSGDKLNPVKFQEFWTFCRDIGGTQWQLSGINQMGQASPN